jgi:hypothetical protein
MERIASLLGRDSVAGETAGSSADSSHDVTFSSPTTGPGKTNGLEGSAASATARAGIMPVPADSDLDEPPSKAANAATTRPGARQSSRLTVPRWDEEPEAEDPSVRLAISGRVLDEAGEAVAWVELQINPVSLINAEDAATVLPQPELSDLSGFFTFSDLPPGDYRIRAAPSDDYAPAQIAVRAGDRSADLVVSRRVDVLVYGAITSTAGGPLAGVAVTPTLSPRHPTYSDQWGRYELVVPATVRGRHQTLRFHHEHHHEELQPLGRQAPVYDPAWDLVPDLQLDVSMVPIEVLAELHGRLTDRDGAPVIGENVQLYSPLLKRRYGTVSDHDGAFVIANVAVTDDYFVRVRPQGPYRDYERKGFEVAADGRPLNVVLSPLDFGRVLGQMVDVDGNPVPDFTLWLRSQSAVRETVQVTGDGEGHFFVEDVPSGRLLFQTESFPSFSINGPILPPGGEEEVSLVLDRGDNGVLGRVVDSYGQSVSTPDVFLYWSHNRDGLLSQSTRRAAADASGYFQFAEIGPGRHTLSVTAPGFQTTRLTVNVGDLTNDVLIRLQEVSP